MITMADRQIEVISTDTIIDISHLLRTWGGSHRVLLEASLPAVTATIPKLLLGTLGCINGAC